MPFSKYLPRPAPGLVAWIAVSKEQLPHKIKYIILNFTIYETEGILGKANNLSSLMEYLWFI